MNKIFKQIHPLIHHAIKLKLKICLRHLIDFIVKSDNENKNNNEKMKNISQYEIDSADKEVFSFYISLNDQLTEMRKLHHQEYLK